MKPINKGYWINSWSLWCSLWIKEYRLLLRRPAFFILWALFSALAGLICFALLYQLIHSDAFASPELTALGLHQIITAELIFPLMGTLNVLLMVLVPGLLAKLYTQEYQQRTDWLWFQGTVAPPWMVLLAKWSAGILAAELLLSVLLLFPFFFWTAGIEETVLLLTGLLGLFFQTLLYGSITLFFSFLLRSSTLVLFATYATIMSSWMLTYLAQWSDTMAWQSYWLSLAPAYHFEQLAKGHVTTATIFYYSLILGLLGLWTRAGWWRRQQAGG